MRWSIERSGPDGWSWDVRDDNGYRYGHTQTYSDARRDLAAELAASFFGIPDDYPPGGVLAAHTGEFVNGSPVD